MNPREAIPSIKNRLHLVAHLACGIVGFCALFTFGNMFGNLISLRFASFPGLLGLLVLIWFLGLFTATRIRALGNIIHECAHESFVESKKGNMLIGQCLSVLLLISFKHYKEDHQSHHKHLKDEGLDRDLHRYKTLFLKKQTRNTMLDQILLAFNRRFLIVGYNFVVWREGDFIAANSARVFWLLLIACTFLIAFLHAPGLSPHSNLSLLQAASVLVATLSPAFIFYPVLCVWSDIADHCMNSNSAERPLSFERSRNHIFKIDILKFIFFPRIDAYHLVHHLNPSKPVLLYPQIHRTMLKERSEYEKLDHTLRFF